MRQLYAALNMLWRIGYNCNAVAERRAKILDFGRYNHGKRKSKKREEGKTKGKEGEPFGEFIGYAA